MMEKKQFLDMLSRFNAGKATTEEQEFLRTYYNLFELEPDVLASFEQKDKEALKIRIEDRLLSAVNAPAKRFVLWKRIAVAAAVVMAVSAGIWFYNAQRYGDFDQDPELSSGSHNIVPGKSTATLTLANGKTISLSDVKTGVIIEENSLKYSDGTDLKGTVKNSSLTVTTPPGGTYQVTLPDGTRVWLNAASSLTYTAPLSIRGGIRKVVLNGEAYFEVYKNKLQPFVVKSKQMELTVMGTHFNVSAYADESSTKATLLEGSVRVALLNPEGSVNRQSKVVNLLPSQQSIITSAKQINVKQVEVSEVVGWKDGEFRFAGEELAEVMKDVERWYNVQVIYKDNVSAIKLTGSISRYENVNKLLEMLENTKEVKFRIDGRKVYVSK